MLKKYLLIIAAFLFVGNIAFADDARLLRYPHSSNNEVVFCYGGDIYKVSTDGGIARKLTTDAGLEMYPRFSPDGKTIAYTGQYDGNREIYMMPAEGGAPNRITYSMDIGNLPERMGPDKIIMQWTADGKQVMYRARAKSFTSLNARMFKVDADGGLPEEMPLMWAGYGYLSPDGNKLAFNRIFREYRTWKHYRGGQADDIYIIDMNTREMQNITKNPSQDIIPLWHKNKVYFMSDRDHTMNLFCYDITTKQTKKVTNFNDYDVKFPSLGEKYITFQNGGYIYLMDLATDEYKKLSVQILEDFPYARPKLTNVKKYINSSSISPDAKRALFSARGDIYTVPAKNGKIRNLTKSNNAHDRNSEWSPNGKWIAYVSDESGEDEIYIIKPDGSDKTKVTSYKKGKASYRYGIKWSPDSKKILNADKLLNLYVIDIETKKTKTIAHSDSWEFSQFNWAPDSRWVAYADGKTNDISVLYIYSMENKKAYQVTSDFFNSSDPEFSENGKYLYFVSDRTFRGKSGHFEYNVTFNDMSTLFALTLQDTLTNIFTTFESDEVEVTEETKEKKSKKKKTKKDKKDDDKNINIDLDGIGDRVFELPVKSANYGGLVSVGNKLYYVRASNNGMAFYVFDFEEKEESEVGDFAGYEISANGKNILLVKGGKYYIEKLGAKVKAKNILDLSKMETMIDRKQEWEQIFDESWRQMKYFFYDPSMHKVDWNKIYKRYKQLVKHCTNRDDLTYVVGEMIGEVNCSHAYVGGGDAPKLKKTGIGLLGADIIWDGKGYKLERILRGRNWEANTRSPLTGPGIDVKEGQYIVAIDGVKLTKSLHPLTQLTGKVNEYVTLSINSTPNLKDAKEVIIKTIANESKLRYYNWVEDNREKVNKASNGKIAYIHIPDMGFGNGLNEFFKYYFPQQDKEGLIIDDRYNGGGNVSTIIMERLKRNFTLAGNARNAKNVTIKTGGAFLGPMVCLINENSMSDGDLFPYQFKQENLGKIIGKRSWGGVIGIRGSLPFVDGGYMTRPEFSHFSSDGRWILESHGQDPDIEIDNNPIDEYYGQDDQLTKGLEVIKNEMKTYKGPKLPKVPAYPNRSK